MKNCILILLVLTFFSCRQKFNKQLWSVRDDMGMFPNRKSMLDDVIKNHAIKGRSYRQIVELLGEEGSEANKLYYNIITDYGWDIDPIYLKSLVITFDKDSIAIGFEIKEWRH